MSESWGDRVASWAVAILAAIVVLSPLLIAMMLASADSWGAVALVVLVLILAGGVRVKIRW